jgi:uncharacterized protein
MENIELLLFFFGIAAIYASAGFGGGSSYLAMLALYGVSMATMRPAALLCNIVVVTGGTWLFWRTGHLNFKKIIPLSIASVPMAFLGGMMPLKEKTFFLLLGISLVIAALLMFFQSFLKKNDTENEIEIAQRRGGSKPPRRFETLTGGVIGSLIGFLSGMVGIGGGIFLAPVLNLMKWDAPKNIAATASFFILINSISGLAGQLSKNPHLDWAFVLPLMCAVFLGGQLGSRLTTFRFNQALVRRITAVLVLYAGVNILWNNI